MGRLALGLMVSLGLCLAGRARAQDAGSLTVASAGQRLVVTRNVWGPPSRGTRTATVDLIESGIVTRVYQGRSVRVATAVRADSVGVAMIHGGDAPFVQLVIVDAAGAHTVALPRPASEASRRPATVLCASEPDGYAVLWQEQAGDPTAGATSVMAHVSTNGTLTAPPAVVSVPWGLAALAWNGHGFHLAVLFGGFGSEGSAGQARICLVTLTAAGQPEQHPWWATPFTSVGEVQLSLDADGSMWLAYTNERGEAFVHHSTAVGQWGTEPAPPEARGSFADAELLGVRRGGGGVELVHVPVPR